MELGLGRQRPRGPNGGERKGELEQVAQEMGGCVDVVVENGLSFDTLLDGDGPGSLAGNAEAWTEAIAAHLLAWSEEGAASSLSSAPVHVLSCAECGVVLTERGMTVRLLAEDSIQLYSTDLATGNVAEVGDIRGAEHCACGIRDVACRACGGHTVVGYHVVDACPECLSEPSNNHHYWMFHAENVSSSPSGLSWGELGSHLSQDQARVFVDPVPDAFLCGICMDVVSDCVVTPCGHSFCLVCITRAVDLTGSCPMDRTPVDLTSLIPNRMVREFVDALPIRCPNSLSRVPPSDVASTGALFVYDDSHPPGCSAIIPVSQVSVHLAQCPHTPRPPSPSESPSESPSPSP